MPAAVVDESLPHPPVGALCGLESFEKFPLENFLRDTRDARLE